MSKQLLTLVLLLLSCDSAFGLFCYNCSATHKTTHSCVGDFALPNRPFNSTNGLIVNCTGGDNAMCFVRSWRARSHHAWIVQRGCYVSENIGRDPLPKHMNTPTRAMTCSTQRLCEAEYKVCLCHANWCNTAPPSVKLDSYASFALILYVLNYIFSSFGDEDQH